MNNPKVLILRKGDINPDPRIERTVYALSGEYDLEIFAFDSKGQAPKRSKINNIVISRFRGLNMHRQKPSKLLERINLILYFLIIQFKILTSNYKIIHACDFDTYFPAIFVSKLRSVAVVYDIYDFYFDIIKNLPLSVRKIVRSLDVKLMKFANHIIIADQSRFEQLPDEVHCKTSVIYNTPPDLLEAFKRKYPHSTRDKIRIIYLGLINFQKRDMRFFLDEAIKYSGTMEVVIYGKGKHLSLLKKIYGDEPNIYIYTPIPYIEAMEATYNSDYVLSIYDPGIGNNKLASPNKVFEAMMLAKPILINRELKIANSIRDGRIGFTFDFGSKESANECLKSIKYNNQYKEMSNRARDRYDERFSFSNLQKELRLIYRNLLKGG